MPEVIPEHVEIASLGISKWLSHNICSILFVTHCGRITAVNVQKLASGSASN